MLKLQTAKYWREYKAILRSLRRVEAVPVRKDSAQLIPDTPGIYLFEDRSRSISEIIYVGETNNLRTRLTGYHLSGDGSSARVKHHLVETGACANLAAARSYIETHCYARYVEVPNAELRLLAEKFLVALCAPPFNR